MATQEACVTWGQQSWVKREGSALETVFPASKERHSFLGHFTRNSYKIMPVWDCLILHFFCKKYISTTKIHFSQILSGRVFNQTSIKQRLKLKSLPQNNFWYKSTVDSWTLWRVEMLTLCAVKILHITSPNLTTNNLLLTESLTDNINSWLIHVP